MRGVNAHRAAHRAAGDRATIRATVIELAVALLFMSCTTTPAAEPSATTAAASPSSSASPATPSPAPTGPVSAVALHGATFAMDVDDETNGFFADRGALVALGTRDGPPPYSSKVLFADPLRGPWRSIYTSDARYNGAVLANGFLALLEYREQGAGAYSERLVILDLPGGRPLVVDAYSLSAATFRGGGGGPPRPTGAVVLGGGLVAWVRLVEGSGGSITGELRVGLPNQPAQAKLIASSDTWIRPISVDASTLVYRIARGFAAEIRARDLASGAERVLVTRPLSDTSFLLPFDRTARSGAWVGWIEEQQPASTVGAALRAVNVSTGALRELPLGDVYCATVTGNDRFFALNCSGTSRPSTLLIETTPWTTVPTAPIAPATTASRFSGPFDLRAAGLTELIWQDRVAGQRRAVLFTPTLDPRSASPTTPLVSQRNVVLGYELALPAKYRLALSSLAAGAGQDYFSPRTPAEDQALCQAERGGGLPSPERSQDLHVIVSAPGPMTAVEYASAPQRHVLFTALEEVTIDGHDAVRVVRLPTGDGVSYFIHANDRIYEIAPLAMSFGSDPNGSGWVDEIALSFKAIAVQPAPGNVPPARSLCGG